MIGKQYSMRIFKIFSVLKKLLNFYSIFYISGSIAETSNSFDSSLYLLGLLSLSISGFVSVMYIICFKIHSGKSNSTDQSINEAEGQDNRAFKQDNKKRKKDDRKDEENN